MVKIGSYAYCIDTTGVHLVKIFQALRASYKKTVTLGDVVFIVIRGVNTNAHFLRDDRIKFKFRKGSVHRAIVVHTREKFKRKNRTYI
jgi:ribosomal protein L14